MYYCWLNIENGKFSCSWTEEEHEKYLSKKDIEEQTKLNPHWKLIRFECINDSSFMFNNNMKLR